ncbi:MAG: protein-export chaperone SecB [Nevskiales bacterium]
MTEEAQAGGKQVAIQKIYVKDASVEVPNAPSIFTSEWKPQMDVQLNTGVQDLSDEAHEVVLTVTVTAKLDEQTAYLVEVKQAGVFLVRGFEDEAERRAILGAYCPNTMFPFVRETVADMVVRAGFPHFLLQPVNFDALYQQHLQQRQNKGETKH